MSQQSTERARRRTLSFIGLFLVLAVASGTMVVVNVVKGKQKVAATARATRIPDTTATALAKATVAAQRALQDPYPPFGGSLVLNDTLRDNSKGYKWGEDTDDGTCRFRNAAYYIDIAKSDYVEYCEASAIHFNKFAYQAQMTIVKGDRGGITFLVNDAQKTLYYFGVGQDGSYVLDHFIGEKGTVLLKGDASMLVHTGLNSPNTVAVAVLGSSADLYINRQLLVHVSNINFSPGCAVGLAAQDRATQTEVVFNDAKVWAL